jgi:hypothetical protein
VARLRARRPPAAEQDHDFNCSVVARESGSSLARRRIQLCHVLEVRRPGRSGAGLPFATGSGRVRCMQLGNLVKQ